MYISLSLQRTSTVNLIRCQKKTVNLIRVLQIERKVEVLPEHFIFIYFTKYKQHELEWEILHGIMKLLCN